MNPKHCISKRAARSVIAEIFEHPPVNSAEFETRLAAIRPRDGRRILMEMLSQLAVEEESFNLFLEVFGHFGIGDERDRLLELLADHQTDPLVRTFSMAVLAQDDPVRLTEEIGHMDPGDLASLADLPLIEILKAIQMDPHAADEIIDLLEGAPEEMQEYLLFQLGRCRRDMGVSAAATYNYALRSESLKPFHRYMIDAIVKEGAEEGIALLEELKEGTEDEASQRYLQGALLRAHTRAIDPHRVEEVPTGVAYIGSCDGQGAFVVLGCFKTPGGTFTTANLCIRVASDLRDGFVIPRQTDQELQLLMKKLRQTTGCDFASLSLADAAEIVDRALNRTAELDLSIPDDAQPAIRLFERLLEADPPVSETRETKMRVTVPRMRQLLKKPVYQNWFFDLGDLLGVGIRPPGSAIKVDQWYEQAAARLDTPPIRSRLRAMTEHMARWHQWRGEDDLAQLCAAATKTIERRFVKSGLVRAMLERTLELGAMIDEEPVQIFGDPQTRQYLKARFFAGVKSPKSKDLSLLDFTEVALHSLDAAFSTLPGERRPRDEEKPLIAFTISEAMWEITNEQEGDVAEHNLKALAQSLTDFCQLDEKECVEIGMFVLQKLGLFIDEVCATCPVACIKYPQRKMTNAFFSTHHPADS